MKTITAMAIERYLSKRINLGMDNREKMKIKIKNYIKNQCVILENNEKYSFY
jgi:hypothetical protein